jgi:hypothetical protein
MKHKKLLQRSNARLDILADSLNRNQEINFSGPGMSASTPTSSHEHKQQNEFQKLCWRICPTPNVPALLHP